MRYDLDALGAIDANHLIVVEYLGSAIGQFNFARVNMTRLGLFTNDLAGATNPKGVVTLPLYLPDVAANATVAPCTVLLFASRTVAVMVAGFDASEGICTALV